MTFIDAGFFLFLFISFAFFYIVPQKYRWIALLVISMAFYALAGLKYVPFLVVTALIVFLAGRGMGKSIEKNKEKLKNSELTKDEKKAIKADGKKECKKIMLVALIITLVILCIVKYTKFFISPINSLIVFMGGEAGSFTASSIIVPLGISYYTFSSISYLLDVYWKRVDYEKNFFRFLLYLVYFPHILQGPIERYGRLGARLKQDLTFDFDRIVGGLQLMLWGYFKKLVIADRIHMFISDAYGDPANTPGSILLLAAIFDVVYIYSDFSGCMDIARGVSQIFGVELDLNFNHPFSSLSVVEFWRRWHMSLGGWFKDYVYYPVSTSNLVKAISKKVKSNPKMPATMKRAIVSFVPVFVTWVLTGVWHGTGKNYVAWGLYYAVMIFLSVTFSENLNNLGKKLKINYEAPSWKYIQMARTTLIFAGGRFLTSPGSLHRSVDALRQIIFDFRIQEIITTRVFKYGMNRDNFFIAVLAIAIFWAVAHAQKYGEVDVRVKLNEQNVVVKWMAYFAIIIMVVIFGVYGSGFAASSFVYMQY